jgi:hypothetical protein
VYVGMPCWVDEPTGLLGADRLSIGPGNTLRFVELAQSDSLRGGGRNAIEMLCESFGSANRILNR